MNRSELLRVCAGCPGAWKEQGCIISDLEGCKDEETLPDPQCSYFPPNTKVSYAHPVTSERKTVSMDENPGIHGREIRPTFERKFPPMDEEAAAHRRETDSEELRPCSPPISKIREIIPANPLDPLDLKILKLLAELHYERSISRITGRPRSTVKDRIRKLRSLKYIKPEEGSKYITFYTLTARGADFLVYDEPGTRKQEAASPFTLHCSKFSFPIISGLQPRSKHPVKMHNWTGYDFPFSLYTIRTTPRALHVFMNIELSGESVEALNEKYQALAIGYAGKFAEKHGLIVGEPKPYQIPHLNLPNTSLAKIISEVGTVKLPDMHIDRSRSSGDLEMSLEAAKGMEYTIAQMPAIVAGLRADMESMKGLIQTFIESMIPARQERPPGYA